MRGEERDRDRNSERDRGHMHTLSLVVAWSRVVVALGLSPP